MEGIVLRRRGCECWILFECVLGIGCNFWVVWVVLSEGFGAGVDHVCSAGSEGGRILEHETHKNKINIL